MEGMMQIRPASSPSVPPTPRTPVRSPFLTQDTVHLQGAPAPVSTPSRDADAPSPARHLGIAALVGLAVMGIPGLAAAQTVPKTPPPTSVSTVAPVQSSSVETPDFIHFVSAKDTTATKTAAPPDSTVTPPKTVNPLSMRHPSSDLFDTS